MKIIIFGATGGVGQELVQQALEAGHEVSVFVRTPSKLDVTENVNVIVGDAKDQAAVTAAIAGHEAVLSGLGSTTGMKKSNDLEIMGANIAAGMQANGVGRLVYCASAGVHGELTGAMGKVIMWLLRNPLADHRAALGHFAKAGLSLTIARPTSLSTGPLESDYLEAFEGMPTGKNVIARASVAHFMLKALNDSSTYAGTSVGLVAAKN